MAYNPGFTGGQCQAKYRVILSITNARGDIGCTGGHYGHVTVEEQAYSGAYPAECNGPISGFTPDIYSFCPSGAQDSVVSGKILTATGDVPISLQPLGGSPVDGFRGTRPKVTIARVERIDGLPDNCGNLTPIEHPANSPCSFPGGNCSPSISY
jgi:hypothetical protein